MATTSLETRPSPSSAITAIGFKGQRNNNRGGPGARGGVEEVITLRNVNTMFADAAIYPPLKMYGSFEMPLGVKPSEDGRRLVASYTHLSLNTQKIAGTPPPPHRFRELRRQILELL